MKTAIIGSRNITNVDLSRFLPIGTTEIVSGGARGVDTVAKEYANRNGLKLTEFLPDYEHFGRGAPLKRNITIIENAAKEPHIVDLANFLNTMGADVRGAGTDVIKIRGVEHLHGCEYSIIPDQIEAGTYMVAAAATRGDVLIKRYSEASREHFGKAYRMRRHRHRI